MAVFNKVHRNMGLSAFGQVFQIGEDGRLSPDPDAETTEAFRCLANYEVVDEAPVMEAAPVKEEAEADPEPEPASKKRTRKKKTR